MSCDIPAAHKVCGFVLHNASLGCSKCLKHFPTSSFGEKPNFSGFDRNNWTLRTSEIHRQHAYLHKSCNTLDAQRKIEREHGCRYSVLLELPYFDAVQMYIIDPMHNLLLGMAKHMIGVWKSCNLLSDSYLSIIQDRIDSFIVPHHVGRIPYKIASGFAGFTAEQWKNWILLYSLPALKGILPFNH